MASLFRDALVFLNDLGLYDVVLPFLLVFTVVFAILEKTKIFGIGQDIDGNNTTKKNLNAMFAFVIAFLVIASTRLVAVINESMANIVLLLLLAVSFLLLVGAFFGDREFELQKEDPWMKFFVFFMFIGIVLIFLNSLDWLNALWDWLNRIDREWASSLVFLIITGIFVALIVRDPKPKAKKSE